MADADRQAVAVVAQVIHLLTCRATALKAACDGPTSLDFETARSVIASVRPHLLAAEVSAHRAEQDAVHADLSQMLRVLGMGDHARPQSSHEVMLDAINEVGRLRTRLAEIENAVTWNTSCTSCATVLDSAYRETCRREAAEAALVRVRALDSAAILIGGERYVRADYVREALEGDDDA